MPKIAYQKNKFHGRSLQLIHQCETIIDEYEAQGFTLTLRQLYYQLVSRGFLMNNMKEYKRIGSLINDARLCGLIDWYSIEDRTRNLAVQPWWTSPTAIIRDASSQYRTDIWRTQPFRPEIWIEKDALSGVINDVCRRLSVPYFSCRGYTSQSEMWNASQRLKEHILLGQTPYIIHLGDHDPSGIDMSRDIEDRLKIFLYYDAAQHTFNFTRIALNIDQVREFNPPPNPAKITDTRYNTYVTAHGHDSWELDALDPVRITGLIEGAITPLIRNRKAWDAEAAQIERDKDVMEKVADQYAKVVKFVTKAKKKPRPKKNQG